LDVSEIAGLGDATPPTFKRSDLQTGWHCMDWSTVGLLHVSDDEIVPNALYEVQAIDCTTDPGNEANYSAPLPVGTSIWGDTVGDCSVVPCTPPDGVVNFVDISSIVSKFSNQPGALIKARSDLDPDTTNRIIDFVDISRIVDAFRGIPYPFDGPDECP
jgi:hypothetical protein